MKKFRIVLILVLVIFLGSILRFYRMRELSTFLADQAIELSGAVQILQGKFTLIGIKTSVSEIRNGAVMYYFLAPFLYLFRLDPIAGGVLQSFLSLSTVTMVYYLGKKFNDEKGGIMAAFYLILNFSSYGLNDNHGWMVSPGWNLPGVEKKQ